jgi:GTPase SAR1 family protein
MGITGRFQRYILENYNAAGELNQSTALRWLVTPPNPNQPIILSMKKDDQISFASNRLAVQKFKIVLVGDQNAGKSSIIVRYIKNDFDKTNNVWNIRT